MTKTINLNPMCTWSSLKPVSEILFSKWIYVVFFLFIQGCNFSTAEPEKFQTINDSTLVNLVHYLRRINTEVPSDTIMANICEQPPTDDEIVQEIINAQITNGDQKKSKAWKYVPVKTRHISSSCKGQSIYVMKYSSVTLLKLSDTESVKIIGQSTHDSAGIEDFALMKYGSGKYAYTRGHLCGSIQIGYPKDTMTTNDILNSRVFDSIWHPIVFARGNNNKQYSDSYILHLFRELLMKLKP
jgi:hypothetical protein